MHQVSNLDSLLYYNSRRLRKRGWITRRRRPLPRLGTIVRGRRCPACLPELTPSPALRVYFSWHTARSSCTASGRVLFSAATTQPRIQRPTTTMPTGPVSKGVTMRVLVPSAIQAQRLPTILVQSSRTRVQREITTTTPMRCSRARCGTKLGVLISFVSIGDTQRLDCVGVKRSRTWSGVGRHLSDPHEWIDESCDGQSSSYKIPRESYINSIVHDWSVSEGFEDSYSVGRTLLIWWRDLNSLDS